MLWSEVAKPMMTIDERHGYPDVAGLCDVRHDGLCNVSVMWLWLSLVTSKPGPTTPPE